MMEGIKFISVPDMPSDSFVILTQQRLQEEIVKLFGVPERMLNQDIKTATMVLMKKMGHE